MKDILNSNLDLLAQKPNNREPVKAQTNNEIPSIPVIEIEWKPSPISKNRKSSNIYEEKMSSQNKTEYAGNIWESEDKTKRSNNPCYSNMFERELKELPSPK